MKLPLKEGLGNRGEEEKKIVTAGQRIVFHPENPPASATYPSTGHERSKNGIATPKERKKGKKKYAQTEKGRSRVFRLYSRAETKSNRQDTAMTRFNVNPTIEISKLLPVIQQNGGQDAPGRPTREMYNL